MLTLPIKKKWFDMIKSGEKKEEYREIKPYYDSRFQLVKHNNALGEQFYCESYRELYFRNGYKKDSPTIKCRVEITIGTGRIEWGAEKDKLYYVLKILSVEKVK